MNEVVNGIAGSEGIELALLPRGTGRDFARGLGIPRGLGQAVRVALEGEIRVLDLGLATFRTWAGAEERAYFANAGSAGISGAIARRANDASKALGGRVSYYWATLSVYFRWRTGPMRVAVDDQTRQARMIDVLVANGRYLAGGMKLCPDAIPDDGLFDILLIGDVTTRDLLFVLPKTYRGKHLPHPRLELLRGRTVTIEPAEAQPVELDGEQPGTTPARFELVQRALRVRVPRGS